MAGYGYGYGYGLARKAGGVSYDAMAAAYFAAVPNAFDAARKTIINTFIAGLRSDGNLTKLDRLWLFANTTSANAVIDVIGLNSATLINSPGWVADQGYTGDGATRYINSNFAPATNGVNLLRDSHSMGVYSRTTGAENTIDMGVHDGADYFYIQSYTATGGTQVGVMMDGAGEVVSVANGLGLNVIERSGASVTEMFKNGSSIDTGTVASTGNISLNIFVLARNANGAADNYSSRQLSIAFLGSGDMDQSALYTRIQQYMTDLGTQV